MRLVSLKWIKAYTHAFTESMFAMLRVCLENHGLEITVYLAFCWAHMCCTLWIWGRWKATPVLVAKVGRPVNPISLFLSYTHTHTYKDTHTNTHGRQAQMVTCSPLQTKAAFICVPGPGRPEHRTPERVWELLILIHSHSAATEPYKHISTTAA